METNKILQKQIMDIIHNQMKANNPPETNITYKRLKDLGYADFASKQLIGQCVLVEIVDVLKSGKPFDETRYIKHLRQLPKPPVE